MTEEQTPMTPEELAAQEAASRAAEILAETKRATIERLVSHMNVIGASIVQQYPMAEVQSWSVQKLEAEALLAISNPSLADATSVAPFLSAVAAVHHGPATDAERLDQIKAKAAVVKGNADAWAALSAYVNGLRARTSDRVNAATSVDEVFTIRSEAATELETWRQNAGV